MLLCLSVVCCVVLPCFSKHIIISKLVVICAKFELYYSHAHKKM